MRTANRKVWAHRSYLVADIHHIPKYALGAENSKYNLRNYADFVALNLRAAHQSVMLAGAMR